MFSNFCLYLPTALVQAILIIYLCMAYLFNLNDSLQNAALVINLPASSPGLIADVCFRKC